MTSLNTDAPWHKDRNGKWVHQRSCFACELRWRVKWIGQTGRVPEVPTRAAAGVYKASQLLPIEQKFFSGQVDRASDLYRYVGCAPRPTP